MNGSTQQASLIRGIRSDGVRDLARRAVAQGFDASMSGKGHVRLTPPEGGRPVYLSASSTSGDWHEVKRARANLVRAGFDPFFDPRAARKLARPDVVEVADAMMRPTPEVPPMAASPTPSPEQPRRPTTVGHVSTGSHDGPNAVKHRTYERIAGVEVRVDQLKNGRFNIHAHAPAQRVKSGRWLAIAQQASRESAIETAQRVLEGPWPPPVTLDQRAGIQKWQKGVIGRGEPWPGEEGAMSVPTNGHTSDAVEAAQSIGAAVVTASSAPPSPIADALATPRVDDADARVEAGIEAHGRTVLGDEPSTVSWLTVRVDAAEYPLARALADLVDKIAPAVQALEASGRKAAADLLVESVEMTPAEAELAKLWADVHGKPRLETRRAPDDD